MKRGSLLFLCLLLLFGVLLPVFVTADEVTENLESRILESFDPETRTTDWYVRGSKFITEDYPKITYADAWPEALFGRNRDENELQVLGVNAKFDRMGYNYLEFIPVKEGEDGELEANPIPIPGRAKQIDLWIWGSMYDYYMEVHISDYRGVVWVIHLGSINYRGWRNLRADIPHYIPQSETYVPHRQGLALEKLVLWTKPTERVADFYMYIDQIKILTDMFESRFDGDDLTWPEKMEEMWGEE
ncbi:MAG: flagellar filament outer layer protein FlaA [Spirochaetales bacterium]|nr:flagellar filament outer layer protein FlaA [Spirochaetales bacterium]